MELKIESGMSLGEVKGPALGFEAVEVYDCSEWVEVPQKLGLDPSKCVIIAVDLSEVSRRAKVEFDPAESFFEVVPHRHLYNFVWGRKSYYIDLLGAPTAIVLLHRPDECKGEGRPRCDAYWQILPGRFFVVRESVTVDTESGRRRVFVSPEGGGDPARLGWLEAKICRHRDDKCFGLGQVEVYFVGDRRTEPGAEQQIKIVSRLARAEGERAARRVAKAYLSRLGLDMARKRLEDILRILGQLAQVHSKAEFCIQEDGRGCVFVEAPSISPRSLGSVFLPHPSWYNIVVDPEGRLSEVEPVAVLGEYALGKEDIRLPDWAYGTYRVKCEIFRPTRRLEVASEAAARPAAVQALAQASQHSAAGAARVELVNSLALRENLIRVKLAAGEDLRGLRVGVRSLSPGLEGFYRFYFSLKRDEEVAIYLRLVKRGFLVVPGSLEHLLKALSDAF